MALLSYALTTVDSLLSHINQFAPEEDLLQAYHDGTGGVTSATVAVTASEITLVTNLGTDNLLFTASPGITAMAATINALAGWTAVVIPSRGAANSADLSLLSATSAFLLAAQQTLVGRNVASFERAINAATELIERYCSRRFALTTLDQKVSGTGRRELSLPGWPISAVLLVAFGFREYFTVINSSTDAAQATAQLVPNALHLVVTGGANASNFTSVFTGFPTIGALITQINTLGKGWSATLSVGADNAFLSTDLFEHSVRSALQRTLTLRGSEETINNYEVDKEAGILLKTSGPDPSRFVGQASFISAGRRTPWELRPTTVRSAGPFWREGMLNYFVRYSAGFSPIPADVEHIANQVAANIIRSGSRDTALTAESLDGHSYSTGGEAPLTSALKTALSSYRTLVGVEFASV